VRPLQPLNDSIQTTEIIYKGRSLPVECKASSFPEKSAEVEDTIMIMEICEVVSLSTATAFTIQLKEKMHKRSSNFVELSPSSVYGSPQDI
jgi:hypothetical protein